MILFHGGYTAIDNPEIIQGKYAKDFGQGFYCTAFKEQAIRWAKRFDNPLVNVYEYKINEDLNSLTFDAMTEQWLDFVVECRRGKEHNYDIVTGPMANDQIYNYVADYISGILTGEQFWVLAKFKHPTHQIAFCSEKSLDCISFIKSEML